MANPYFKFKQFTVYHHLCSMKVGIDGVLLGAWADTNNTTAILDIGTGSGLIALMLAQRSQAEITAIDIEAGAILQTKENVANSPWANRITAENISLQKLAINATQKFDLIVSNPPFFVNSLKAPETNRNTARHTDTLSHEELLQHASELLSSDGKFCVILPVQEGMSAVEYGRQVKLYCSKIVRVFPKPGSECKRLLIEFSHKETTQQISELTIETEQRHQYTPEFTDLARNFYLKL